MSKFKVGDRVKCLEDYDAGNQFTKGETYVVKNVRDTYLDFVADDKGSSKNGWAKEKFEPAYTSCAAAEVDNLADEYGWPKAKFKVGDRVREKVGGATGTVREAFGDRMTINWDDGVEGGGSWLMSGYERVAAPTTALRIEAGKFYKTRDGRKVGPAAHYEPGKDYGWPWDVGDSILRRPDGKAGGTYPDTYDLIAEWTDISIADIVVRHSASGTAIVAVLESGQPRPATRPYVHTNSAAAETEANRLARTNPGKEFGVYTLGAVAKVEKTYDHEWQRLAANGRVIEAIKELRAKTGLGLAIAKGAVEDWLRREDA